MTRSHRVRLFMPFVLGLVLCVGGCRKDYKKVADRMVEENLLKLEGRCEAIGFLEQGGRFFDDDETTTVDRDVVLPLLKQVRETARTDQWVVPQPNNAKQALALLIELPDDQATVDRMAKDVEAADDKFGVACLGGECFGEAGGGFLRFSCAEPNDRLEQALAFIPVALSRTDRINAWLQAHPEFRLKQNYT